MPLQTKPLLWGVGQFSSDLRPSVVNDVDPFVWLKLVLERLANGRSNGRRGVLRELIFDGARRGGLERDAGRCLMC